MKLKDQEGRNRNGRLPGGEMLYILTYCRFNKGTSISAPHHHVLASESVGTILCVHNITEKPTENGEPLQHFSSFFMWNNCWLLCQRPVFLKVTGPVASYLKAFIVYPCKFW